MKYRTIDSPIGKITLFADNHGLYGLACANDPTPRGCSDAIGDTGFTNAILNAAEIQLTLYFQKKLRQFSVPFNLHGTPFQVQVWKSLAQVQYGQCISYGELATCLGNPSAVRAVASAVAKNPIPIIIPCQRVVGHNGRLSGFASGLELKRFLLHLEGHTIVSRVRPEEDVVQRMRP